MKKLLSMFFAFALVLTMLPAPPAAAAANGASSGGAGFTEPHSPPAGEDVIVAVVDTGVDYTHKDLADKMLTADGAVKGYNAITRQESGFMDDSFDSHGTMAAGVVVAEVEKIRNETGIDGGPGMKIMPVKALNAYGNAKIDDVADGIRWAADNGADIINLSVGEWLRKNNYPTALSDAVKYAQEKGAVVVAAAGNGGEDISQEKKAYYPASLPGVVSVGSTGGELQPSKFSNTGAHIYAPGEDIYSTQIGGTYGYGGGTSMAAARVSGDEAARLYNVRTASVPEDPGALPPGEALGDDGDGGNGGGGDDGDSFSSTGTAIVSGFHVDSNPTKLSYTEGEPLDLSGLSITANFSDSSSVSGISYDSLSSYGIHVSPAHGTELTMDDDGDPVIVSIDFPAIAIYACYLEVAPVPVRTVTGIVINTSPKLAYQENETLDLSDLSVTISYSDNTSETVDYENFDSKGITVSLTQGTTLTTAYNGTPITVTFNSTEYYVGDLQVTPVSVYITGITIDSPPTKMTYQEGETMDLRGLSVIVHYSDSTSETISFEDLSSYTYFISKGISISPSHSAVLTMAYDAQPVKLTFNDIDYIAGYLHIVGTYADFLPANPVFDKNPPNQADVAVEIIWRDSPLSVTGIKNGTQSLGTSDYTSGSGEGGRGYLTIDSNYLAAQPKGNLILTVEFTGGKSAPLTIKIKDTSNNAWPVWPPDTTFGVRDLTPTSLTFAWGPAQDDVEVAYYEVKLYQVGVTDPIRTVQTAATSFHFTGLTPNTLYRLDLQAFDDEGEFSAILPYNVTTPPAPGAPSWPAGSSLTFSATPTTVNLSWTPAQDDIAVTGYRIYQDGTLIQTVGGSPCETTVPGLLPSTGYNFQVQAGDGNTWTTDGPQVTARTSPGVGLLILSAPRRSLNGSLYMGDTVKIQLVSTESGLNPGPQVTVTYKKWNEARDAVVDDSAILTLSETQEGSRVYSADFTLTEGICRINALEAAAPGVSRTTQLDTNVAGRLKAVFSPPPGLTPQETGNFNNILRKSIITVRDAGGNGIYVPGPKASGEFLAEGLEAADDYVLTHFNDDYTIISQTEGIPEIRDGLETEFIHTYASDGLPSYLKVKVVDEATGLPVSNATVTSGAMTFLDGYTTALSAVTGDNGFAARTGEYFAKNIVWGSDVGLTVSHNANSSNITDWYETKTITVDSLNLGENEPIVINLKKISMVTLEGKVTDSMDTPLKNVFVSMPQTPGGSLTINASARTGDDGRYAMQVATIPGEVSFSFKGKVEKRQLTPAAGTNTLDVKMPPPDEATVNISLETITSTGQSIEENIGWLIRNGRLSVSVKNESKNLPGRNTYDANCTFSVGGAPGDTISVFVDGTLMGFGKASATAVLNAGNQADVKLVLKANGSVGATLTDELGNDRTLVSRYMIIYPADGGPFVTREMSNSSYISCILPDGSYKAVLTWDNKIMPGIAAWEDEINRIITPAFRIESGKAIDLGTQRIHYDEDDYFRRGVNDLTSSSDAALPGLVITLRASYDYDRSRYITPGKLDLVAAIPLGSTYVQNSASNRVIRGNITTQPVIDTNARTIKLDLKEGITEPEGIAGALTYQVRLDNDLSVYANIVASAEMKFDVYEDQHSEVIGAVMIPTSLISIYAPAQVARDVLLAAPIELNGFAPPNSTVELYDGQTRIGGAKAVAAGGWSAAVSLPDKGAPAYHFLRAVTTSDGQEYESSAWVLAVEDRAEITQVKLTNGGNTITFDPRHGVCQFPFVVSTSTTYVDVFFSDGDRVDNVKISGFDAERHNGSIFSAAVEGFPAEITVQYDEEGVSEEEILWSEDEVPEIEIKDVQFVDGTADDVDAEFGADYYLNSFSMPDVRVTTSEDKSFVMGMNAELISYDTSKASNYCMLEDGLYGYDLSYKEIDGGYEITAYLDRRLFSVDDVNQAGSQTTLHAAGGGLGAVKAVVEAVGAGDDAMKVTDELSTSYKLSKLEREFAEISPDMDMHLQDYYFNQVMLVKKQVKVERALSLVAKGAEKVGDLVPVAGQIVVGLAGLLTGKLLDDMFENEFNADYERLMREMESFRKKKDDGNGDGDDHSHNTIGPGDSSAGPVARPRWIHDPSGFAYEAVEDNRIEGATATALFLPKEKAADAAAAKNSSEWEFWDAGWYLQENPQTTNTDGKYAWNVPEGWWMVQFVKDGYRTAYSDALPVPPPQTDINVPMVKLSQPGVESVVWGSGGRYVDIYFSKYMDLRSLEAPNSVSLAVYGDNSGATVQGNVISAVPEKTNAGGQRLTRVVRFEPDAALTGGGRYTLTINKAVADYAGFTMAEDYTADGTVPAAAAIESLVASDITVEPGRDITQAVKAALTFTPVDPADQGRLDTRAVFVSSNANVVGISDNGDDIKVVSLNEGRATITATSVDSGLSDSFTVTVAVPSATVRVSDMVILDANGSFLSNLSINFGDTYTLNPSISPSNAVNKNMSYSTDNASIAIVSAAGVIRGVSEGLATITAKTADRNIRQRILVKVLPKRPSDDDDENDGRDDDSDGQGGTPAVVPPPPVIPSTVVKLSFTDVKDTDWFCAAVKFLVEKGITEGVSETAYAPDKTVTRAEFITMLCRAFGIGERSAENFADAGNTWYTGFLAAARQLGLANGVGGNRFEPERAITREEMVVILYNYYKSIGKITGPGNALTYADSDSVASWAREAVGYASANGWVNGRGNNIFDPKGVATRAELAQILYNILRE